MSSDSDYPAMRRVRSDQTRRRRRWRVDDSEDERSSLPPRRSSSSSSSSSRSSSSSDSSSSGSDSSSGRSSSSSDSSSGRSSSGSDSGSGRSSSRSSRRRSPRGYRSRSRSPRRSRSRSQRRSRSRSRSPRRNHSRSHAAAAGNEFTVRIDNYDDLFNCALCHGLLSSRVYECGEGHLTCHRCHDSDMDLMPCVRCGSKDYTRSRAVTRMVRSVRFACRNREHGCAASLPRLGVEHHERSCRYEPCFCPVCKRAFVPDALEGHLTGRHAWHLRRLTYGEPVAVDVDPDRPALLSADDGELFHLDLSRVARGHADDDGSSLSVIRMRPDNAAAAEAEFSYELKPPGAAWRMQAPVWSSSLRRGMEDGSRVFVTVPEATRHRQRQLVSLCVWRLPARS